MDFDFGTPGTDGIGDAKFYLKSLRNAILNLKLQNFRIRKFSTKTVQESKNRVDAAKKRLNFTEESHSEGYRQCHCEIFSAYFCICEQYFIRSFDVEDFQAEKYLDKCRKSLDLCYKILMTIGKDEHLEHFGEKVDNFKLALYSMRVDLLFREHLSLNRKLFGRVREYLHNCKNPLKVKKSRKTENEFENRFNGAIFGDKAIKYQISKQTSPIFHQIFPKVAKKLKSSTLSLDKKLEIICTMVAYLLCNAKISAFLSDLAKTALNLIKTTFKFNMLDLPSLK